MTHGLIFPVDQIPLEGLSGRRVLEASWFSLPPEAEDPTRPLSLLEPVVVDFHLERFGRDVRLGMAISTVASLTCSRCLKAFPFQVREQVRFTFCRTPESESYGKDMALSLEDLESAPLMGDEIDLSDLIYEQIVLSLPMKPLCCEGCKGLCAQCGADRNEKNCGCSSTGEDPRWSALRKLKVRL